MKRLEKLKTTNYKQLAIQHGEKLVVVVIGVLVVSSLLFGTRWKRFHGKPSCRMGLLARLFFRTDGPGDPSYES